MKREKIKGEGSRIRDGEGRFLSRLEVFRSQARSILAEDPTHSPPFGSDGKGLAADGIRSARKLFRLSWVIHGSIMHGVAHEAVFIYCECAATKQIGLPGGEKRADDRNRVQGFEDSRVRVLFLLCPVEVSAWTIYESRLMHLQEAVREAVFIYCERTASQQMG